LSKVDTLADQVASGDAGSKCFGEYENELARFLYCATEGNSVRDQLVRGHLKHIILVKAKQKKWLKQFFDEEMQFSFFFLNRGTFWVLKRSLKFYPLEFALVLSKN